ncbi:cofactor-independent phosphoglycerate mutase [Hygrophoropsis aurantiaca]|uniref:Cofactor-independent phosphoglycerate mutase n=1 Tax=Hygrophoropsis aurantiaca TaxID=72124 RepID=A0ACB8AMP2_9AGAM|nr:cofactor-independent phosphoglycerate mutase [Hygrophoropsis aurantiaca]
MPEVKHKVCLIVHDGWGVAPEDYTGKNAIAGAASQASDKLNMDKLAQDNAYRTLEAHGNAVGLTDGLMGNSEVGHLNIGAGRVVWQDIVKIDVAIRDGEFNKNDVILKTMKHAMDNTKRLHLIGLVSDGGVHSHIEHLKALINVAQKFEGLHVYIHYIADGRDTAPCSAASQGNGGTDGYVGQLLDFIKDKKNVELADVMGRYFAMDRDKRWDRVKIAVQGMVNGVGEKTNDVLATIRQRYSVKKADGGLDPTDEFLKPIIVSEDGRIKKNDTLFFFNYRSDRMREIVTVLGLPNDPPQNTVNVNEDVPNDLYFATMSKYKDDFSFPIAFPPQPMTNVLAEWFSSHDIKQCHIAETEKFSHVTKFFNGGVDKQFKNEDRIMEDSPRVATYDLQPGMSVQKVADTVAKVVKGGNYEFVMCNFAPPDMVGHTGNYDAAVEGILATDHAVGTVAKACHEAGYVLLITADHGNSEKMEDTSTGGPNKAHTTSQVPFIIAGTKPHEFEFDSNARHGALADVAPTILAIMGLSKPQGIPYFGEI